MFYAYGRSDTPPTRWTDEIKRVVITLFDAAQDRVPWKRLPMFSSGHYRLYDDVDEF